MSNKTIHSRPCPSCSLCGARGESLYKNLEDRLFGAWGKWNLKKCPDPHCGIVWLDPMPLEEDIVNAYQTYYTHADIQPQETPPDSITKRLKRSIIKSYFAWKYDYNKATLSFSQKLLWPLAYLSLSGRVWLDSKVMYLRAPYKGRLLEIGAGSGEQLKELIEFGWDGEGVDSDVVAVEKAVKNGLRVQCGTVEAQRYPDNSFDVIIMNHVIEHVHDPLSLLRECYRILRPGGKLAIVTPNILSLGHRMFKASWFPLDPPRHLRIYTPPALLHTIGKAGFTAMNAFTTARNANGIFWTSRAIKQSGKCTMHAVPPASIRFLAWIVLVIELILLKMNPSIGEEIAVIATKEAR